MVDLTAHKAGIDAAFANIPQACGDPRTEFLSILRAEGFTPPRTVAIGRIDRIDGPEDKRGKKSGWYVYNEIEDSQSAGHMIGAANYGDWKTGYSASWSSRTAHQMNVSEKAAFDVAREQMRVEREREEAIKHAESAAKAYEIWSGSKEAESHEYLTNKGVSTSQGLKIAKDGRLIIPVAVDNEIVSLQFIAGDGQKRFLTGGKTKGGWFLIEGKNDVIYIAEGYSTARSVHEATNASVYIAFNAGNLYEVCGQVKAKHPNSRIIIAGDDDTTTTGNAGRTKATQAADGLRIESIFPSGYTDFNDQHQDQGIKALKKYLNTENLEVYKAPEGDNENIPRPMGILSDMVDYYHATSGNKQEGFAVQTALAITSIVLGRSYRTGLDNFASLYLLNVGKSGTGKEHAKTVVEKILHQASLPHFIAGDGYTSAGAVFSTLLDRPKHISVIDEFGRYLEAGRDLGKGNHHQREANTKLMESIGRGHSIMRPPSYSSMTLKKDAADAIKNRMVHNPAITLLTMTTPTTLFKTLDMGAIKDGFINRFILSISDAQRDIRRHKPPIDVPDRITSWIKATIKRNSKPHISTDPASPITLEFTQEALDAQLEFQYYCVDKANSLEKYGMAELTGRSNEMAMKIGLIHALSRDPYATEIDIKDMDFGISYIKLCLEKTIERLKVTVSHSEFEADKKEILADIRKRAPDGITWAEMQKTPPYSKYKGKDLKEIMQALKDADLVGDAPHQNPNGGRPTVLWTALK